MVNAAPSDITGQVKSKNTRPKNGDIYFSMGQVGMSLTIKFYQRSNVSNSVSNYLYSAISILNFANFAPEIPAMSL